MPLDFSTVTCLLVGHDELERFIKDHLGKDYSVAAALEATNGSDHALTVTGTWPSGGEPPDVTAWLEGDCREPDLDVLMDHLAASGAIPTGDYLVGVSW
ncbi:hypothetical protein ACIBUR_38595 [Streptomyces anulatus]